MEHRNINTVGTIFNDFLGLYTGERPVGIHELIQKYDRHPVLMGLLSNVDSVIYVDVKKAMYEIYPFYKKYRHHFQTRTPVRFSGVPYPRNAFSIRRLTMYGR